MSEARGEQSIQEAREYLTMSLENFDYACTHENDQLKAAIVVLLGNPQTGTERVTIKSTYGMRLKMFFDQSSNFTFALNRYEFPDQEHRYRKPHDYDVSDITNRLERADGYDYIYIQKIIDTNPVEIVETKKVGLKREEREVSRQIKPGEEGIQQVETIGKLYIRKTPHQQDTFSSVDLQSHWILEIKDSEEVDNATLAANLLSESFPEIKIEIVYDFIRKRKKAD